jgi:hypothetical protein
MKTTARRRELNPKYHQLSPFVYQLIESGRCWGGSAFVDTGARFLCEQNSTVMSFSEVAPLRGTVA